MTTTQQYWKDREDAFHDRMAQERYEDEQDEARAELSAREMAFSEYEGCTPACIATLTHQPGCVPDSAPMAAATSWAASMGLETRRAA